MHGEISLESQPNVGSKATFSLPFRRSFVRRSSKRKTTHDHDEAFATQFSKTEAQSDLEARPLQRISPDVDKTAVVNGTNHELPWSVRAHTQILVVEDNAINQNIVVNFVKKLGFPVQAVWNGREALDYLTNSTVSTPRPHIVLMDCQMPIMDGYQATRELRSSADEAICNIPVVALTASAIKGDRKKCEAAGMDDYITKPVTKHDLEKVLVRWALRSQDGRHENPDCML